MSAELRRAFDFIAAGDMRGERRERVRVGVAVFDDVLPLRHDSNYLLVTSGDAGAAEIYDAASWSERPAVLFTDVDLGERVAPYFATRGWLVHRGLVMVHRGGARRAVDTSMVEEVDEASLRPSRREQLGGEPWATADLVEQRLDAKLRIAQHVGTRFFAVRVGGKPVSWTDVYLDARTAQVEDVATLPDYRRRGYASAVVSHAVSESRRAGCDFVFLVTDADDWPQHLYRALGFEGVGGYMKLFRPLT
jgi:ribosomal protein S18 acetylase RimI-like enzyme